MEQVSGEIDLKRGEIKLPKLQTKNKVIRFDQNYKEDMFYLWYKNGKPTITKFHNMMPSDSNGDKPSLNTILKQWHSQWKERASILDEEVKMQMNAQMISEKVEMLNRHAKTGVEMQDMGLRYLKEHEDELGTNTAVRLLIEGVNIEQNSRGIGTALKKMMNMDDADLLEEIAGILEAGDITISKIED